MSYLAMSDKGWLRQHWPQHNQSHLERFINLVVKRLNYVKEPTTQQLAAVRWAAYKDMTGSVE